MPNVVPNPVFVKVGAHDGITGDPCSDLLLANPQWRGLLVEPVPYCFERLKANFHDTRRFQIEQKAIGLNRGHEKFYYVDAAAAPELAGRAPWFSQLGSFQRDHIVKHLGPSAEAFIVEQLVEVQPLADLLRQHGIGAPHLLHIDAEGYDDQVLKSLDFSTQAPWLIFLEHKHIPDARKSAMLQSLFDHGYSVRDCGVDFFAVNERLFQTQPGLAKPSDDSAAAKALMLHALIGKTSGEITLTEARFLGELVAELSCDGPIIEIGTHLGFSTYILSLFKAQARELISVDNYSWNALSLAPAQQLDATRYFLREALTSHNVKLFVMDKAQFFADYSGPAPALVFLDANHSYDETRKDLQWALKSGAKLITGHDYSAGFPGVMRAVDESGGPAQRVDSLWLLKR